MPFKLEDAAELMTATEVADRLRVKPATVYEAANNGRLPCIRLWRGRRRTLLRFRRDHIERLIKDRSVGAEECREDDQ